MAGPPAADPRECSWQRGIQTAAATSTWMVTATGGCRPGASTMPWRPPHPLRKKLRPGSISFCHAVSRIRSATQRPSTMTSDDLLATTDYRRRKQCGNAAANDYRVLAPVLITDPNGNRAAVSFDALGMVAGTAVMGKTTENLGDSSPASRRSDASADRRLLRRRRSAHIGRRLARQRDDARRL